MSAKRSVQMTAGADEEFELDDDEEIEEDEGLHSDVEEEDEEFHQGGHFCFPSCSASTKVSVRCRTDLESTRVVITNSNNGSFGVSGCAPT
jgi:hypothetical protein